ncbi:SRPBCC domain-containing protein [Pelagovum pacificum]|uniref:Activator of Hsp90 ATPase homologue 1/2-like C-terminal domain-containing protein n=1 Tax=Pelagovum pacificum TaxID=2588711 RepID=A0A5C5G903_9RHOB|nr:SRPBCC domain-containing protein [Pelagovum pacificum]QQA42110.1 SRPBCC domain-containing protein [Pelagovum pacificum]TNY31198.1 hypothetical protein FHY64_14295 [Pelagovum pacificum]
MLDDDSKRMYFGGESFQINKLMATSAQTAFQILGNHALFEKMQFGGMTVEPTVLHHDFREGGVAETAVPTDADTTIRSVIRYEQIVPGARIIATYSLFRNDTLLSLSLVDIRFREVEGGTRVDYNESVHFYDPQESGSQRRDMMLYTLNGLETLARNLDAGLV